MAANGRGRHASDARDRGFTLVEIVIAIVLTGVLAAVVVVGVGRLVEQGSGAGCAASADAARAAVLVHRTMTGSAPASFSDLLGSGALEGSEGVTTVAGGMALAGSDWTLVWYGNGERPPRLECSTVDLGTPGLTAEVFNSSNFTNPIQTVTHTGPTSANWGYGSPLPGMGEAFSVRYTGTLTIPSSGTWTFTSTADNAVTIWINDQRLLTNNATATTAIAADTYPIRIDFTEVGHAASWNLTWTPPGTNTPTTIPATALTTA